MPRRYIMILLGTLILVSGCNNSRKISRTESLNIPTYSYIAHTQLPISSAGFTNFKDFTSSQSPFHKDSICIYTVNNSRFVQAYTIEGIYKSKFPISISGNTITALQDFEAKYRGKVHILIISETSSNKLLTYAIDSTMHTLEDITSGEFFSAVDEIRFTVSYYSVKHKAFYLFVAGKRGMIEHWELKDDGYGHVEGKIISVFNVLDSPSAMTIDTENDILYITVNNEGIYQVNILPTLAKNPTPMRLVKDNHKYFSNNFGGLTYSMPTPKFPTGSLILSAIDNGTFWRVDLSKNAIAEQLFIQGNTDINAVKKSMIIKPIYGKESEYILSDNDNNGASVKLIHID